jgi:hypothetical protein
MKKVFHTRSSTFAIALLLLACNNNAPKDVTTTVTTTPAPVAPKVETFCFAEILKTDSTNISLTIEDSKVTGTMLWHFYEGDMATGTLTGTKTTTGELDLVYAYTFEGAQQTETKMMKIENGQLMIKKGALEDPKNDGNLRYKDATKAIYKQTLKAVACK